MRLIKLADSWFLSARQYIDSTSNMKFSFEFLYTFGPTHAKKIKTYNSFIRSFAAQRVNIVNVAAAEKHRRHDNTKP